jgi:hypothetical protein
VRPSVLLGKEKGKRLGLTLGPKELGRLVWPNRLGLARGVSSAWGSAGRLGSLGWLAHLRAGCVRGPAWASSFSGLGLLPSPPRWLGCLFAFSFSLTGRPHKSASTGSSVAGSDPVRQEGVRVCVPKCVCAAPEVCSGKGLKGLATGLTRTARPWRRHGEAGHGRVPQHGCTRTRAGPGVPGPRRGRAVRGAPASQARGTTRRRRGDDSCGDDGGATGPYTKRWHGGRRGMGGPMAGLQRVHRHRRQQRGKGKERRQ